MRWSYEVTWQIEYIISPQNTHTHQTRQALRFFDYVWLRKFISPISRDPWQRNLTGYWLQSKGSAPKCLSWLLFSKDYKIKNYDPQLFSARNTNLMYCSCVLKRISLRTFQFELRRLRFKFQKQQYGFMTLNFKC